MCELELRLKLLFIHGNLQETKVSTSNFFFITLVAGTLLLHFNPIYVTALFYY